MLISRLPPNVHLQQSYETILNMLDKAQIRYETDEHIIKRYDPDAVDENGDPLPKPAEGFEGTGTAWIKCFFDDRKVYYLYFCCHLVDCSSCEYDRFITIYNYTDDVIDTNYQGELPIQAIYKRPEGGTMDDPTALYYESTEQSIDFIVPKSTELVDIEPVFDPDCEYCHGTGKYTMDMGRKGTYTIPCPNCNPDKKGDTKKEASEEAVKYTRTITLYNFYADFFKKDNVPVAFMPYNINNLTLINDFKDIEDYTDAPDRLFVKGVFETRVIIDKTTGIKSEVTRLKDIEFFLSTYKDITGQYIPVNVVKRIIDPSTNTVMYDDMTGYDALDGTVKSITDENYATLIQSSTNFTTHCVSKTFTDIFDFAGIWNYICYKDRNLTIFPLNDSLNIAHEKWFIDYSLDDPKYNNFEVSDILNHKVGSGYSTLDAVNPAAIQYYYATGNCTYVPLTFGQYLPLIYDHVDLKNTYESKYIDNTVPPANKSYKWIVLNGNEEKLTIKEKLKIQFNPTSFETTNLPLELPVFGTGIFLLSSDLTSSCGHDTRWLIVGKDINPEYSYYNDNNELVYHWGGYYELERTIVFTASQLSGKIAFAPITLYSKLNSFTQPEGVEEDLITNFTLTYDVIAIANADVEPEHIDEIIKYPMVDYNYNGLPEGVFQYYQPLYNTYINSYLTYRYTDVENWTDPTEFNRIDLNTIDTYEEHGDYKKQFFNILTKNRLKSIYYKDDKRTSFMTCPYCGGELKEDEICEHCNNTGKMSYYDVDKSLAVRFRCPKLFRYENRHTYKSQNCRCRTCAGTSMGIHYLYYNCYEFKDLTTYNGKIPAPAEFWPPIYVGKKLDEEVVKITTATGEKDEWPYLNYLLYKKFHINAGKTLDYETYGEYYKHIKENLVLYYLNGDMTKYYYWNGQAHIDVKYGYNYIYSTKTFTAKEWEKAQLEEENRKNTVLYRVLPDEEDFDDYIAFYAYAPLNKYGDESGDWYRIYFDEDYIFNELSNDLAFNQFNYLQESKHVINKDIHIHNEDEPLVEERCPACRCSACDGHGYIDDEECETCHGTGISDPNCTVCGGTGAKVDLPEIKLNEKYLYKYITLRPITCDNISYETMVEKKCTCYNCGGTGKVDGNDCSKCDGTGEIGELP